MKRVYKAVLGCKENGVLSVIIGNDQCQASDMVLINPSSLSGDLQEGFEKLGYDSDVYYGILNLAIVYNPVDLVNQYVYMLTSRETSYSSLDTNANRLYMMDYGQKSAWQDTNPIPMLGTSPEFKDITIIDGMQIIKQA